MLIAAQMWLFGRILPLVIGDQIPDDDRQWQNFLVSMEIVDHLFCPKVPHIHVRIEKWFIEKDCDLS